MTKAELLAQLEERDAPCTLHIAGEDRVYATADDAAQELAAEVDKLLAATTMPQQGNLVEPPDVDTDVIAFVKKVLRPNGPRITNIRFTGEPVDGQGIARALGENLTWVADEPRQDARGCWWTNVITSADARAYSSRQYLDATSGPRNDEVAA